jgi:hypothetical protein
VGRGRQNHSSQMGVMQVEADGMQAGRGRNRKSGRQAARQRGVGKQKQAGRGRHEVRYASNR